MLTPHQQTEAANAMSGWIGVLAGSPGTGKTYTLAQIIRAIQDREGSARIAVCAPTGKAAVRATESLAAQGIDLMATTIHRLLGVEKIEGEETREYGWRFVHGSGNPLSLDFLFVDEASMVDTTLLASLLSARPAGCHVLLIGDPNQLAPVGHGAPLRDLIAVGLPCGTLTEIQRNAGRIVRECARIRDRYQIRFSDELDVFAPEPENLILVEESEPAKQIEDLERTLDRIRYDPVAHDPIWDVQIVVPVNDKSPLARKSLNRHLQRLLNPNGQSADGSPFRVGDKVVCTKNGTLPLIEGETNGLGDEAYVANGEQARVLETASTWFVAELESPRRTIRVPRSRQRDRNGESDADTNTGTGCDFDLAYAMSVHKSQGSEWPIVIVMLDGYYGASRVMTREWIYTAISRAKEYCVCIGPQKVADAACRRSGLWHRKTFLQERIEEQRGKLLQKAWSEDLNGLADKSGVMRK